MRIRLSPRRRPRQALDPDEVRTLPDEALLEDLHRLGVVLDPPSFREAAAPFASAAQLSGSLARERRLLLRGRDEDRLWMGLMVLWERWLPERPSFEMIDDWIEAGYEELERGNESAAAEHWLQAWAAVAAVARERGFATLERFDDAFAGIPAVYNWVQDVDDALHNAGLDEPRFWEEAIRFNEEFLRLFPDEDSLLRENKRRALAESHAKLGRREVSDRLYRGWLEADPSWGWGWIGWADTYFLAVRHEERDFDRSQAILREGLAVPGVRDAVDVRDRRASLFEYAGRHAEAAEARKQIESLEAEPDLTVSRDPRTGSSKVSFDFGGRGLPVERMAEIPARAREILGGVDAGVRRTKVGRNEPCPCGSGRKFKKCCGR